MPAASCGSASAKNTSIPASKMDTQKTTSALRAVAYLRAAMDGKTQVEIAAEYGVSKQSVERMLKRHFGESYRALLRMRRLESEKKRRQEDFARQEEGAKARCLRLFLCSPVDFMLVAGVGFASRGKSAVAKRYLVQRRNAERRGIEWSISLPFWYGLLSADGRLSNPDYVVSRKDFSRGFTADNVEVKTSTEASSDSINQLLANGRLCRWPHQG